MAKHQLLKLGIYLLKILGKFEKKNFFKVVKLLQMVSSYRREKNRKLLGSHVVFPLFWAKLYFA